MYGLAFLSIQVNVPSLAEADLAHAKHCFYTESFDGRFLIDYHPNYEGRQPSPLLTLSGLFVATGGSGHGFKFLPLLGELILGRIEGK